MPRFSLSKVDRYRSERNKSEKDIIDIKFPTELKPQELLVFIADDDPYFLQILNTHFSKLTLEVEDKFYSFDVKNFATGKSCIKALKDNPDLIFLNFYINKELGNAMSGRETLDAILDANPNQKVIILNDLSEGLRGAFVENGLRDY
ncbi:MAG: hypothetical protein R3345_11280, partial [Fulvivirga sp.]|nr:hypothetical protein [Fulvivirga sp.]